MPLTSVDVMSYLVYFLGQNEVTHYDDIDEIDGDNRSRARKCLCLDQSST